MPPGGRGMGREDEPGAGVGGAQHAAEPAHERLQPRPPARQPGRPLVLARLRRRAQLALEMVEQGAAAVATVDEQPQGRVEPLAVQVRVEVAEARGQAAAHLPVRARVLAPREPAAAVAQAEEGVELLDELGGGRAAAHRADVDAVPAGRLARDLEHREGDVEPAAQIDVAVHAALAALVPGRPQRLDQPVLEQQRAELGLRRLIVDVLGLSGPGRRGREVRPRPRAQADRLAHVERTAVRVAEHVDAGIARQRREVRPLVGRPAARSRPRPAPGRAAAWAQQRDGLGDGAGVCGEAAEEGAEHARAGLGVGQRAMRDADLDPERVGQRGEAAAALQRREAARHRDRAEDRRLGPVERGAGERAAQHAEIEAGGVRDQDAAAQEPRQLGQDGLGRRRRVDHRLRDPREALDAARQRRGDADQRGPAVVQLSPADEHRADLRQLAALAREPVRLRVDGDELGGGERLGLKRRGDEHDR